MANLYPGHDGCQERAIPSQQPKAPGKASRICPKLENPTAFMNVIPSGSEERTQKKKAPGIMLACPQWFSTVMWHQKLSLGPCSAMAALFRTAKWERAREGVWSFRIRREKFQSRVWGRHPTTAAVLKWESCCLAPWRNTFEKFPTGHKSEQNGAFSWIFLLWGFMVDLFFSIDVWF